MKERPILFSAPMVRAILEGRKTQTRRVMKQQSFLLDGGGHPFIQRWDNEEQINWRTDIRCPFGVPGDRLWVKETFGFTIDKRSHQCIVYRADSAARTVLAEDNGEGEYVGTGRPVAPAQSVFKWKPSIFMPRWATRITLEVTGVRVERLNDISADDALAEGVDAAPFCKAGRPASMACVESFEDLWCSINGPGSWAANPWVWVVDFMRLEAKSGAA